MRRVFFSMVFLLSSLFSQTQVNLTHQARNVDFSAAPRTRPAKTGTILPSNCEAGDLFFKTDESGGRNLFGCSATNVWTPMGNSLPGPNGFPNTLLLTDGSNFSWSTLGGDVTGNPAAAVVRRLQGLPVAATAPQAGQVLSWNAVNSRWEPASNTSPGLVSWQLGGVLTGNQTTANFIAGSGIIQNGVDTGSAVRIQTSIDANVVLTRQQHLTGADQLCLSTNTTDAAFECSISPAPAALSTGMVLFWRPDVDASATAPTLKINTLQSVAVLLADGVTVPGPASFRAGSLQPIWFDGTAFRLLLPPPQRTVSIGTPPTCNVSAQGEIWLSPGATDVADTVQVCAKDAANAFAWRTLY